MAKMKTRGAGQSFSATKSCLLLLFFFLNVCAVGLFLVALWARGYWPGRQDGQSALIPVSGPPAAATHTPFQAPEPAPTGETLAATPLPAFTGSPAVQTPGASPTPPLPTPAAWDGRERVTILVMGVDHRAESQAGDVPRTDTMILLTIDPVTLTAGMLSIPRDLWVYMPETDSSHKINTAYRWGELYGLPGGGPGQATRTVSSVTGVPIQYYLLLDFNAFVHFIDAMGGLEMDIRETIKVDPVGPDNTIILEPGVQTLNGAVALAYARNRSTQFDDFDRSTRQQEVILAIRKQVLDLDMLPGLVAKAPTLYSEMAGDVRTNLTLEQMIRLAWLAARVPEENVRRSVFNLRTDFDYRTLQTADGPQDVLILKPESMRLLREEMFPEK